MPRIRIVNIKRIPNSRTVNRNCMYNNLKYFGFFIQMCVTCRKARVRVKVTIPLGTTIRSENNARNLFTADVSAIIINSKHAKNANTFALLPILWVLETVDREIVQSVDKNSNINYQFQIPVSNLSHLDLAKVISLVGITINLPERVRRSTTVAAKEIKIIS